MYHPMWDGCGKILAVPYNGQLVNCKNQTVGGQSDRVLFEFVQLFRVLDQ